MFLQQSYPAILLSEPVAGTEAVAQHKQLFRLSCCCLRTSTEQNTQNEKQRG